MGRKECIGHWLVRVAYHDISFDHSGVYESVIIEPEVSAHLILPLCDLVHNMTGLIANVRIHKEWLDLRYAVQCVIDVAHVLHVLPFVDVHGPALNVPFGATLCVEHALVLMSVATCQFHRIDPG